MFTTGTMGELTPVQCIDGRYIGRRSGGGDDDDDDKFPITRKLQKAYR